MLNANKYIDRLRVIVKEEEIYYKLDGMKAFEVF